MELARANEEKASDKMPVKAGTEYYVGSTASFQVIKRYFPGQGPSSATAAIQFKCLAKGAHCYIWTPTSTASNVYPHDSINPAFAQMAADEFDAKHELMTAAFGAPDFEAYFSNSDSAGRINLLYFNIVGPEESNGGWTPGSTGSA